MSYSFMSNIYMDDNFNSPESYFQEVGLYRDSSAPESPENGVIKFNDVGIQRKAKFLMIRSGASNEFIIQLSPSKYCVHLQAGELWSVDSIEEIDKLYIKNIFQIENDPITQQKVSTTVNTGKLQWMIGYK